MATIIAIGGGSVGFKNRPAETTPIDQEIIKASNKTNPHLLFIPTASSDNLEYIDAIKGQFGTRLGCTVDTLLVYKKTIPLQELEEKILGADIIYVGGGNTLMMMRRWRQLGIDRLLQQAYKEKNKVLCGLSAGSICWFRCGNSDSRKYKNPEADLIKVSGLGLINALNCPHYDTEHDRKPSLKNMMRKTPGIAIALDNCAAIQINDDHYKILTAKSTARAYKVYWKREQFYEEPLEGANFLDSLLIK